MSRTTMMMGLAVLAVGLLVVQAGCTSEQPTPKPAPDPAPNPAPAATSAAQAPVLKTPKDAQCYSLGVETARNFRRQGTEVDLDLLMKGIKDTMAADKPPTAPPEPKSYSLGVEMAKNFKRQGMEVNLDLLMRGMKDVMAGGKLLLSDVDILNSMTAFAGEVRSNVARARLIAAQDNRQEGEAFQARNKTKEGVVTLPSGLQYKILKAGSGRKPTDADTVVCQYRGTLINGTEFDSSYRTGQPATLKVAGLVPGWREALKLMPVGSTWQLVIPPQLAYGSRGTGRDIGPNATLIFEVELLDVK